MIRRLPAEWEPQQAVMLTWPRVDGPFAPRSDAVTANFLAIATAIGRRQGLWISVDRNVAALEKYLLDHGVPAEHLKLTELPNNDVWVRDHAPITTVTERGLLHLDFQFNGWGGKHACARDNALNRGLAAAGTLEAPMESLDWIMEGGAIDVDGTGTLLTTEHCVLSETRNGGSRNDFEAVVAKELGIERVLWLTQGGLEGDDTDGHVDTLARFCDPQTIVFQSCARPDDSHHESLTRMAEELAALRTADGVPYHLVPLPLPAANYDESGKRLPASYANFLIINDAVLVPTYGDVADAEAVATLGNCFPGREIIGIDCRTLIHQYGSLHCVTMQVPAADLPLTAAGS